MSATGTLGALRKATYRDVLEAPPHMIAQVVDGALHLHPRPVNWHGVSSTALTMSLGNPFQRGVGGPGGWVFVHEPELHLGAQGKDILVPDLVAWRKENYIEPELRAYYAKTPDWVCEFLSPSTQNLDKGRKSDIYAREGASHLWLLDPVPRTLEAFAIAEGAWRRIAYLSDAAEVSVPPFEEISFSLSELWEHFGGNPTGQGG